MVVMLVVVQPLAAIQSTKYVEHLKLLYRAIIEVITCAFAASEVKTSAVKRVNCS